VLIHEKVDVAFSCSDGVCGTCGTRLLEGAPDHRESFLTDDDMARNAAIMICCSGSRTSKLVLDL
jgi:tetrachlorobenzoquinone reductase